MSKKKEWLVHIIGPDDVIYQSDELAALRKANVINKGIVAAMENRRPDDPYMVAVVRRA